LRAVESLSGGEISNAYLSQIESGRAKSPSPRFLRTISTILGVPYDEAMRRAGHHTESSKRTLVLRDITQDEEMKLIEYLYAIRKEKL
jgi:transcriptional regulator with XRE-family HTH domain